MNDLTESVDTLTAAVEGFRKDVRGLRRRFWRTLLAVALDLCLSIGLSLSIVAIVHSNEDRRTETEQARIGSCEQYNKHEKDQARIEIGESHDQIGLFVAAAPAGTDPVKARAFVVGYNRVHDAKIRAVHKEAIRDCTPAGIAAYLKGTK